MNRWLDRLITLALLTLLGWGGWVVLHWLLVGADWSVVNTNLPLYAVGSYPINQRWRPLVWIGGLILLTLLTLMGPKRGALRRALPLLWRVRSDLLESELLLVMGTSLVVQPFASLIALPPPSARHVLE